MKTRILLLAAFAAPLLMAGCDGKDPDPVVPQAPALQRDATPPAPSTAQPPPLPAAPPAPVPAPTPSDTPGSGTEGSK